jgi:hypothetical protein
MVVASLSTRAKSKGIARWRADRRASEQGDGWRKTAGLFGAALLYHEAELSRGASVIHLWIKNQ